MRSTSRMRSMRCRCLIALITGFVAGEPAMAWSLRDIRDDPWAFAKGFATGILVHEAAHVLLADLNGYRVDHDGLSIVYPDATMTPRHRLRIASAGFQAQWLASEYVLSRRGPSGRLSNFDAGIVLSQFAVSVAYLSFLDRHDQGDIAGMRLATGWSNSQLAWSTAIPAILDTYRLLGRDLPRFVPRLSLSTKGALLGAIWTF